MDKRVYAILALLLLLLLLLVGGLDYYLFAPRCEQPDDMTIAMAQYECIMQVNVSSLRAKACQKLYDTPECEFKQSDLPAVQEILNGVIRDCTKASLKARNYCTDKYKDIE